MSVVGHMDGQKTSFDKASLLLLHGCVQRGRVTDDKVCLAIELKINFLKPSRDDKLAAEAKVNSGGKGSFGVVQSNVYCETGDERILSTTAIVTLRAIRP